MSDPVIQARFPLLFLYHKRNLPILLCPIIPYPLRSEQPRFHFFVLYNYLIIALQTM